MGSAGDLFIERHDRVHLLQDALAGRRHIGRGFLQIAGCAQAQGILEAKIAQLKGLIANARLIDESQLRSDVVQIMSKVKIKNVKNNMVMSYTLVSDSEANLRENKIAVSTPIAKGLMGKKVGDVVDIKVPSGIVSYQVEEISI